MKHDFGPGHIVNKQRGPSRGDRLRKGIEMSFNVGQATYRDRDLRTRRCQFRLRCVLPRDDLIGQRIAISCDCVANLGGFLAALAFSRQDPMCSKNWMDTLLGTSFRPLGSPWCESRYK